ncbi:methyltransferase [Aporhodopirellula aestuarii]|uniref:Methyltransferase domain-containing protein n=1 Tax=Aporhodopirellula aestuarii TaxID=2950107 RepID=A0ABT0UCA2_9BACT|nr:methyltransferase [Aporhodopirellula aestuarii]MCM2374659.1 methyltransferase domain-containing protein [Aporhodopirellula aestuarii]
MNKKIRIAFVDDNAEQQLRLILGERGYPNRTFRDESGREFELVAYSHPDVFLEAMTLGELNCKAALLDIDFSAVVDKQLRMVDGGTLRKEKWGIEVLHTVKRIDPDFPVVMLTSLDGLGLAFDSGKLGADGYINKSEVTYDSERFFRELADETKAVKSSWKDLDESETAELEASYRSECSKLARIVMHAIGACNLRSIYSHEHLATADEFASEYDEAERKKVATVAYYQYETDRIAELIQRMLDGVSSDQRLRILDVGCGTGRIEEALCESDLSERIDLVAVDFSGAMIRSAHAKLKQRSQTCDVHLGMLGASTTGKLNVSLFRATAERLGFLGEGDAMSFDLVVLGFGFLSYVNYREVLKSNTGDEGPGGVFDLLRPGGKLVFSVYNEASAVYDRIARTHTANDEMPVAAVMDPATGFLQVDLTRNFACDPFTVDRITRFVRQGGLTIDPEDVETFPTLHLMVNQSECADLPTHPIFAPGRWDQSLYELDRRLSKVMPNRGHYIVGVASRPKGESK